MNGPKEAMVTAIYLKKLGAELDGMADKCSPSSIALARAFIAGFCIQEDIKEMKFENDKGEPLLVVVAPPLHSGIRFPRTGTWEDVEIATLHLFGEKKHYKGILRSVA